ncbi:MAG TPA: hypothetical protein PKK67_09915, partial [Cyclobacteriaceae bacterium]|nr:hypothetical protein [Cyclobacteriaceae bacterium]
IGEDVYMLQNQANDDEVTISFGIEHTKESFLPLPTTTFIQEPLVKAGDKVRKGDLIAKGVTHIYFQANKWIFSALVFIIGILTGIGGAAVYKHISEYYPNNIGAVGGIVGVIGGLAGFFNPIIFGFLLKESGIWTTCWMFLFIIATACIILQRLAIKTISKNQSISTQ